MTSQVLDVGTVITGAGDALEDATIVVEDGVVTELTQDATDGDSVDLTDKVVMPGLIDAHVHLNYTGETEDYRTKESLSDEYLALRSLEHARNALAAGVTTVADVAARDTTVLSLRDAIDDGVTLGPRVKSCGGMLAISGGRAVDGRVSGSIVEVDGPDEARKETRKLLMYYGADLIKLAATGALSSPHTGARDPQLTVEEMTAATEEAHNCGRPVHAHCYGEAGISNALDAGVDVIVHGQSLTDDHIAQMHDQDSLLVPTLATFRKMEDGIEALGERDRPDSSGGVREEAVPNFERALEADIPIAAGTDCGMPEVRHGTNPVELAHYVDLGMTPDEAITAGTLTAARSLNLEDELGSIEPGKHADMLVLSADPREDITRLTDSENIDRILLGGEFVEDQLTAYR